ncbi:anti-sigma factor family protein [Ciceribacter azotifigens]|uniref:anti-sigma factor family protein n=1 Tax=Ciceribacter azotifigens TaxID=2069303 RepID=UPI003A87876E
MPEPGSIDEKDLHAYVDGQLDDARRSEVEAWLEAHPEDAAMVADWQAQNDDIRALFAGHARSDPRDPELLLTPQPKAARRLRRLPFRQMAASLVLLGAGIAIGQAMPSLLERTPLLPQTVAALPQEARSAFLIYASDVRHPVEVGADEQEHLAAWLSKRLDYPFSIPDLSRFGYRLVGGRLVPVGGKAGAMLMYEDAGGERITVLAGRNDANRATSFRYATEGTIETFYWIDGPVGYALSGEISRERLREIAEECYRQFEG